MQAQHQPSNSWDRSFPSRINPIRAYGFWADALTNVASSMAYHQLDYIYKNVIWACFFPLACYCIVRPPPVAQASRQIEKSFCSPSVPHELTLRAGWTVEFLLANLDLFQIHLQYFVLFVGNENIYVKFFIQERTGIDIHMIKSGELTHGPFIWENYVRQSRENIPPLNRSVQSRHCPLMTSLSCESPE